MAYSTSSYGVIMLGKTGMGKSTTGNKLIGAYDAEGDKKTYVFEDVTSLNNYKGDNTPHTEIKFDESPDGSLSSTTRKCRIIINKTLGLSVLDVRGFADSETCSKAGVYLANLEIIRNMIHSTAGCFTFNRVVYFLPNRRIPEKIDGNLQEELKVMYHYFGNEIFHRMVIVVTTSFLEDHGLTLTEDNIKHIENLFLTAFSVSTESKLMQCPPIVHISIKDDGKKVREIIEMAEVINGSEMHLNVSNSTCINCASKIKNVETNSEKICIVIDPSDDRRIQYEESQCHPLFIPKYSKIKKFIGGLTIIITFGISKLLFDMPGFFNEEEICIKCKKSPKTPGCYTVNTLYEYESVTILVNHKSKPEIRKFEHDD